MEGPNVDPLLGVSSEIMLLEAEREIDRLKLLLKKAIELLDEGHETGLVYLEGVNDLKKLADL